jgi:hypothetical protein
MVAGSTVLDLFEFAMSLGSDIQIRCIAVNLNLLHSVFKEGTGKL